MSKENLINQLITLEEKKLSLLKEMKASILYEENDFMAEQIKVSRGMSWDYDYYMLWDKTTEKIKTSGNKVQIQKYLDKRKITKVYWHTLT